MRSPDGDQWRSGKNTTPADNTTPVGPRTAASAVCINFCRSRIEEGQAIARALIQIGVQMDQRKELSDDRLSGPMASQSGQCGLDPICDLFESPRRRMDFVQPFASGHSTVGIDHPQQLNCGSVVLLLEIQQHGPE